MVILLLGSEVRETWIQVWILLTAVSVTSLCFGFLTCKMGGSRVRGQECGLWKQTSQLESQIYRLHAVLL